MLPYCVTLLYCLLLCYRTVLPVIVLPYSVPVTVLPYCATLPCYLTLLPYCVFPYCVTLLCYLTVLRTSLCYLTLCHLPLFYLTLCYLTVLPYCVIAAEGQGPTRDKHLRQLVAATLRGRAFELRNAVQIDHNSVAPQRHGHAQVADIVAKQGTAKYGKLNMGGLVESKVPYDIEAMLARW